MVDWSILGFGQKGLAVEGKTDKTAIEAFLDAGESEGHWSNWRAQVIVKETGGKVTKELEGANGQVWGLIDRDRRTDSEIADLQQEYPQLLVLPRFTIENYCIDPDEISAMLPSGRQNAVQNLKTDLANHLDDWVKNGALWKVLSEQGAHYFCKGHEQGYPMALLATPVTSEDDIQTWLNHWHRQLEPKAILVAYRSRIQQFLENPSGHYTYHIHGKNFFSQVVVQIVLNRRLGQKSEKQWFSDLFSNVSVCPADIVPVLQRVVS